REDVQRRNSLGQDSRVPVRHPGDHRHDLHLRGVRRDECQGCVCLQHLALGWAEATDLEEVVHDADRVEARLIGGACDPGQICTKMLRSALPGEARDLEADLQGGQSYTALTVQTPRARTWLPCRLRGLLPAHPPAADSAFCAEAGRRSV